VDIFRANIVDVSPDSLIVEVTGDEDKVESLFALLRGFGVREMARTGRIAMSRGAAGPLSVEEGAVTTRRGRRNRGKILAKGEEAFESER
jgi:hypothetical protein